MGGAREVQSRWTQEQVVAEEVISSIDEEVFVAVRQHGWTCNQKGLWQVCKSAESSTGGRAHSPTGAVVFSFE